MRFFLLSLLLLAQGPPFVRLFPPDKQAGDAGLGVTPIPEPPPCPCGTLALFASAAASCPGTIDALCSNPTGDPRTALLECDPGGVNPPGNLVIFAENDGTDQCYAVVQIFLGPGMGYQVLLNTGGYIPMSDEETPACDLLYESSPIWDYCEP